MKREARIVTRRRHLLLAVSEARGRRARDIPAPPPLARGELVSLLQRLRDEIDECLHDLSGRRDPSGNRESSRRI